MTTIEELRKVLREKYEAFVKKWGYLNSNKNKKVILEDPDGFLICSSLEVKEFHGVYRPADILHKSRYTPVEKYTTDDVRQGLLYVLSMTGRVDMTMLSEVTGNDEEILVSELGDAIYYNPMICEYEPADRFLAGNVYQKMLSVKAIYRDNPEPRIEKSLKAIREVQPEKVPFQLLDFNLGERWIDLSYYKNFASWLFEMDTPVYWFEGTDRYKVNGDRRWNSTKMSREYYVYSKGGVYLYGNDLLEHALENTAPYLTYTRGNGEKVPDADAIQLAADKIEDMRKKFTEWLQLLPEEDKQVLVDRYNNLYNCYQLRKYDGSHLTLPGIDVKGLSVLGVKEIRKAQKDAAWRIVQESGGIMDWEVGSGKSLIMVIASHEMHRMNIRKKPCILCLKANVQDVVRTYRLAYPSAKILAPSEKDFEKQNRQTLFHNMKNNDWDCVIMTHDQFGKIPQSIEIQEEVLLEEMGNLSKDLEQLREVGGTISRSMRKGLENRKQSLDVKLKTLRGKMSKDTGITFEDMHIDHLLCDESHRFKNLVFSTRHNRVAGLGNEIGSQKALNMLFAIRTLQKRFNSDLQTTFLSGTPISNSLTEMYLLFKYLRPNELQRQNINNFDSWAAVYAKKTSDFEFSVTNQIISKERFRHFIKVPELAMFYNEIADYRTNDSIGIDKPEMVEQLVNIPATADQEEFIHNLILYAKTGNGEHIGRYDLVPGGSGDSARMLIATNYAKKMSTDMRLIDDNYDDHPGNKISVCCEKVAEYYRRFNEDKGVQLIFCDLGVPDKKLYDDGMGGKEKKWTVYQAIKDKLVLEYGLPDNEVVFIHDYDERSRPKLFQQVRDGIVRVLLGSTDKAGTGVNVQDRVVAIHDLDIPWKPAELEQRGGRGARQGNWLAKLKQDNKVYRHIYAVEKSLDTYKFTLLKNKQTFISQMKNNELQVRSIDEGSIDEGTGMAFAEYVAILSGDNTLLEKAKVDKKLAVLENLRTVHYREQHNNKILLEHKTSRLAEVIEIRDTLVRDDLQYKSFLKRDEGGNRLNLVDIPAIAELRERTNVQREAEALNKQITKQTNRLLRSLKMKVEKTVEDEEKEPESKIKSDSEIVGDYVIQLWREWRPKVGEYYEVVGSLYGFNCCIERVTNDLANSQVLGSNQSMYTNHLYIQHPEGGLKYKFNSGLPTLSNVVLAGKNWLNSIDRCDKLLAQYTDEMERTDLACKQLGSMQIKPFQHDDEVTRLREETKRLEVELNQKINNEKLQTV